jgi:hypothetical protein
VTSLWLIIFENDVNVVSKSNKQKNLGKKTIFFAAFLKVTDENSRSPELDPDPLVRCADLDPYQMSRIRNAEK